MKHGLAFVLSMLFAFVSPNALRAETSEIRIAKQVGLASLTLLVMEDQHLLEKHLKAAGLPDTKVSWKLLGSGAVANDALLSGSLDFVAGGAIPLAVLWSKTKGKPYEVKAVCGLNSMPMLLNTRNPNVHSIADFTDKDKIALPAIKVSIQAVVLQMAAAKIWGEANYAKLDPLTVSMNGADSTLALRSGAGDVDSRFGTLPDSQIDLKKAGVHTVLNSYDVLGGPHNINLIYATKKFRDANPKSYAAFLSAFKEATDFVNDNKRAAAKIYLKLSPNDVSVDDLTKMLEDPSVQSSMTPQGTMKLVEFAYRTGTIKEKPASWKELFFPEAQSLPGN